MKKTANETAPAFRLTPQRAEILRLLRGNKTHPSAEDIYARVSSKFPGFSFATVYNTLQSLLSQGRLTEITIDPRRSRFDPCTAQHSHLMCVDCGSIADLKAPPKPPLPKNRPAGFKILRWNVEFYGVCPACAKKTNKKEKQSCAKKKKK